MKKAIAVVILIPFAVWIVWSLVMLWQTAGPVLMLGLFVGLPLVAIALHWALRVLFGPYF